MEHMERIMGGKFVRPYSQLYLYNTNYVTFTYLGTQFLDTLLYNLESS